VDLTLGIYVFENVFTCFLGSAISADYRRYPCRPSDLGGFADDTSKQ